MAIPVPIPAPQPDVLVQFCRFCERFPHASGAPQCAHYFEVYLTRSHTQIEVAAIVERTRYPL